METSETLPPNDLGDSWGFAEDSMSDALSECGLPDIASTNSQTSTPPEQRRRFPPPSLSPRTPPSRRTKEPPRSRPVARPSEFYHYGDSGPEFTMPSMYQGNQTPSRIPTSATARASSHVRRRNQQASSASEPTPPSSSHSTEDSESTPVMQIVMPALRHLWNYLFGPIVSSTASLLGVAVNMLIPVFGACLVFLLLYVAISKLVYPQMVDAISPICHIPGASYLSLPFCRSAELGRSSVKFEDLVNVQDNVAELQTLTLYGKELPAHIRKTELAVRILRPVVRYSDLPSHDELLDELSKFIRDLEEVADALVTFNVKVGRLVDEALLSSRWVLQTLNKLKKRQIWTWLNTFFSSDEDAVRREYLRHCEFLQNHLAKRIEQADNLRNSLRRMESRFDTMGKIIARDDAGIKIDREELLSQLFTRLGGNRESRERLEEQLQLLKQVNSYRIYALAHVMGIMAKMQSMAASLKDLKERVLTPTAAENRRSPPLEIQLYAVQKGAERLQRLVIEGTENGNNQRQIEMAPGEQVRAVSLTLSK